MDMDDRYIDYLAKHRSGFMGGIPIRLMSVREVLESLVYDGQEFADDENDEKDDE